MTLPRRARRWLALELLFLACIPPCFVLGLTLIGHARALPYLSVWLDRLVLAVAALGLPALAALGAHRLLERRRDRR